jgi:hypothetical protein
MIQREIQEVLAGRTHWVGTEEACIATGIGRSRLYQLFNDVPDIKTCSLKRPGTTKGRRLVHLPSLLGYLEGLAIAQGGKSTGTLKDTRRHGTIRRVLCHHAEHDRSMGKC